MTNIEKIGYEPVIIRFYSKEKNLLFEEKILCAYELQTNKIVSIGNDALSYTDNTEIYVCNPLKFGAVADYIVFNQIMKSFFEKLPRKFTKHSKVAFCIPVLNFTEVELKAFTEAFKTVVKPDFWVVKKSFLELCEENSDEIMDNAKYFVEFVSGYYLSEYYM